MEQPGIGEEHNANADTQGASAPADIAAESHRHGNSTDAVINSCGARVQGAPWFETGVIHAVRPAPVSGERGPGRRGSHAFMQVRRIPTCPACIPLRCARHGLRQGLKYMRCAPCPSLGSAARGAEAPAHPCKFGACPRATHASRYAVRALV
jgi:hypothetical protein